MSTKTPNALEQLRQRLTIGAELTVTDHGAFPDYVGRTYTITKAQRESVRVSYTLDGGPAIGWMSLPTRALDTTWIDGDTVSWPLPRHAGATVTYRIGVTR